jgi:hypothetical protein
MPKKKVIAYHVRSRKKQVSPKPFMSFGKGTVFVLGAGFTRAFLKDAPLLVDHCYGDELRKKFADFPDALTMLDAELNDPRHPQKIDIERLMTRLAGGMPYDFVAEPDKPIAANHELEYLLVEVKKAFIRRLNEARRIEVQFPGELWLFVQHVSEYGNHCITFNYDDLLDKALWQLHLRELPRFWSPAFGYGFPCKPSIDLVGSHTMGTGSPMVLHKLHGSMNWRVPHGAKKPVQANDIWHHEDWSYGPGLIDLASLEPLLEEQPILIPPVLTKDGLVNEPVLRIVWSSARSVLREATNVVFIGYSLPVTDIAASFLFREGLRHVDQGSAITVVDYAGEEKERQEKLANLSASYRNVFPEITKDKFVFSGAAEWLRNNLTHWLYDSRGNPVAFNALRHIVSREGRFIGTIRGYESGRLDIWHGIYKADIIDGNRLLFAEPPPTGDHGGSRPPPLPQVPKIPDVISPMKPPSGYRDIDWADKERLYAKPAGQA